MSFQNLLATLTALGLGAILTKFFEYASDRQKTKEQTKHDFKQTRYKAIILLMYSLLDFEKQNKMLQQNNRHFTDKTELWEELKAEWTNMTLYASDNVVRAMKQFLREPTLDSYNVTTLAMRKDLYNIKTKLTLEDLRLD
ncbi:hypothetical protein [Spirosoma montaniterrae]|uniref:Uncharacterized protein n=1 Tax=Spirosoma montaniterrae TaxID=1178516 RepID=A0A1P9WW02_9BACT|nr:hypothetical protein [Spirosoma montaniterrae]AQG79510.1 hypothetical protein AWR27_09370 [Spirosoma montaniterrae]